MTDRSRKKNFIGVVTSNKMDKTVAVEVTRKYTHPVYRKIIKSSKKYLVHDEKNICQIGDKVEFLEGRPMSKRKRWRITKVLEQVKK
ncbi:30S ribosomal protein S17 [bacterium]|nr:30S ribosomal protein S17 [bacterium]MBL7052410.1 30S ribosomal protein S17 [Candidatus Neomarinimicrobiota bacterium]